MNSKLEESAAAAGVAADDEHASLQLNRGAKIRENHRSVFEQQEDENIVDKLTPKDVEPAMASAAGIKLLVDLLHPESTASSNTIALAADCVARLAHTRHGIREAFVAISTVEFLIELLTSPSELISGNAAVALSYLSHNHLARRQLLQRCRKSPKIMQILERYSDVTDVPNKLFEDWKHYKQFLKLPEISLHSPVSLVATPSERRQRREGVHQKSSVVIQQALVGVSDSNQQ